ncbi:hypothetical protein C8J56DRAFT_882059 [Mycena floridula]|nr:hypothetical protein C8J56DRAFT_882059 [Mycena floridula]
MAAAVSSHWRSLALETKRIWATVFIHAFGAHSENWWYQVVHLLLERSGDRPLTVALKIEEEEESVQHTPAIFPLMVEIGKESHSWRALSVFNRLWKNTGIKGPSPLLEALYLGDLDPELALEIFDIFKDAPKLFQVGIPLYFAVFLLSIPYSLSMAALEIIS